jgi:hypothetical protein
MDEGKYCTRCGMINHKCICFEDDLLKAMDENNKLLNSILNYVIKIYNCLKEGEE